MPDQFYLDVPNLVRVFTCTVIAYAGQTWSVAAEDSIAQGRVSFSREIAPILVTKCQTCHNAEKAKGGYQLESFETLMKAGKSKEAPVVPGKPGESKIYQLITATDPDDRMPQKTDPLSTAQVALFKKWIEEGAEFDRPKKAELFAAFVTTAPTVKTPARYMFPAPILALAFNTNGEELAVGGYGEVTFWDPVRGRLLRRIGEMPARIQALAFSHDGSSLALAGGSPGVSGELTLVDPAGSAKKRTLATSTDLVLDLKFSPDGARLASAGADNSIRIYDPRTGREQMIIQQHADWVTHIAFSHDGTKLASASRDRTCRVFDAKTGELETTYMGHDGPVQAVLFSPNDTLVCSAGRDKKIHIWDVKEGKKTHEISGAEGEILNLAGGAREFIASGADKEVRRYSFAAEKRGAYSGHRDWVYGLAIDAAEKRLATGAFDGEVRIWDLESGRLLNAFTAVAGLESTQAAKGP